MQEIRESIKRCSTFDSAIRSKHVTTSQIHDAMNLLLKCYIPLILRQAAIATYIVTKKRPSLLLSPDISDARARLYTLLCKKYRIPSVNVQFGLTGVEAVEWRNYPGDCVAVWGESSRKALLRHGVPSDKIIVTGSPRYEYLSASSLSVADSVRAKLKIGQGRPVVLFASTYFDPTHSSYVDPNALVAMKKSIFAAAKRYPEVLLIVKPHPVECMVDVRSLAGVAENIMVIERDRDGREFIPVCNAFISFGSTMTLDALLSEKLCICPAFPGWPFSEVFEGTGAVLNPRTPEEIDQIFGRIASKDGFVIEREMVTARTDFLYSTVSDNGEDASERIRRIISEMIGGATRTQSG